MRNRREIEFETGVKSSSTEVKWSFKPASNSFRNHRQIDIETVVNEFETCIKWSSKPVSIRVRNKRTNAGTTE